MSKIFIINNQAKINKTKDIMHKMNEKINKMKNISTKKTIDISIENNTRIELEKEQKELKKKLSKIIPIANELKLLNFKLSKAHHDLNKTVTGKR